MAQLDIDSHAIGLNHRADVAVLGDARASVRALTTELERRSHANTGFRTPELAGQIASRRWADEPYEDAGTDEWIDPRTLTIELNQLLPANRIIVGRLRATSPATRRSTSTSPTRARGCSPTAFRRSASGLGNAIGAAIARPDVLTVAAIGDGGAFLSLAELETAARLKLTLLVLIYDDMAYGAEVHHFEPMGHDVSLVRFPDADLAAIAAACGAKSATVRRHRGPTQSSRSGWPTPTARSCSTRR